MNFPQVRRYALSLPETSEEPHFKLTSFRVRGKIFATAPADGTHLHVFVEEELRAPMLARDPSVFEALHWGKKVVGLRITLSGANRIAVERLLLESWKRKAPRQLADALLSGPAIA